MAPVNVDVAEVEARLSALRVRCNALTAQRAAAWGLSAALIAAAATVAVALRGDARLFTITTTLVATAALTAIAHAGWRAWVNWLSLADTAHLADARAALDDRLTTLLAVDRCSPPSSLHPLLVDQLLAARPRWAVDTLAPHRFARSLVLIPLALLILASSAFYARPPAAAARRQARVVAMLAGGERESSQPSSPDASLFAGGGADNGPAPDAAIRLATGGHGTQSNDGETEAGDGASGAPLDSASATVADGSTPDALDKLQRAIRGAFGAPADAGSTAATQPRPAREGGRPGDASSGGHADLQSGAAPSRRPANAPDGKPATRAEDREAPAPGTATTAGGARSSGRGGGADAAGGTMFGGAAPAQGRDQEAAPVAIKLRAITGVSSSQTEPQRRHAVVPASPANATRAPESLPDLAAEQLADVAMLKLDVSPEHEAVVRRIFTRQ